MQKRRRPEPLARMTNLPFLTSLCCLYCCNLTRGTRADWGEGRRVQAAPRLRIWHAINGGGGGSRSRTPEKGKRIEGHKRLAIEALKEKESKKAWRDEERERAERACESSRRFPFAKDSRGVRTGPCAFHYKLNTRHTAAPDRGIISKGDMDRESKKRGREEPVVAPEEERGAVGGKKGKKQNISSSSSDVIFEACDIFVMPGEHRPPGLFEFPWQKEEDGGLLAADSDGRDLRDVFFSSLVDGCSAAIGFPGDRLSPPPGPIALPGDGEDGPWPSEGDADGVDCIWATVLLQPPTTVHRKGTSA